MNPRRISDEQLANLRAAMESFGDLSGLVVNLTTGHTIGGHQRIKVLGDLPVEILRRFDAPTEKGTVAEGVVTYGGERFTYREVRWDAMREKAAMIAANKQGGDWDLPALSALVLDLEAAGIEMPEVGFTAAELADLLPKEETDEDKLNEALLPESMRTVQIVLSTEALARFMNRVQLLGEKFGTVNINDTVSRAVLRCYNFEYGDNQTDADLAADTE